jgi:hypothetical protein
MFQYSFFMPMDHSSIGSETYKRCKEAPDRGEIVIPYDIRDYTGNSPNAANRSHVTFA